MELAPIISREARRFDVPAEVVVCVMRAESSFQIRARGKKGELGLMQLKRGTKAVEGYEHLTDDELMAPALNIRLGVKHMARKRRVCGGEPVRWLSAYANWPCGTSPYSRRVLSRIIPATIATKGP